MESITILTAQLLITQPFILSCLRNYLFTYLFMLNLLRYIEPRYNGNRSSHMYTLKCGYSTTRDRKELRVNLKVDVDKVYVHFNRCVSLCFSGKSLLKFHTWVVKTFAWINNVVKISELRSTGHSVTYLE